MNFLLMTLLFLTSLFLILLVLVQRGRGGGLAGAFGGMGGQSAFGTKAGDTFTRITVGVATFWIVLCAFTVAYESGRGSSRFGSGTKEQQSRDGSSKSTTGAAGTTGTTSPSDSGSAPAAPADDAAPATPGGSSDAPAGSSSPPAGDAAPSDGSGSSK